MEEVMTIRRIFMVVASALALAGQSLVLSTPRGVGLPPVAVRISRQGNSLLVEEPATD
jgi:hypothetical protein